MASMAMLGKERVDGGWRGVVEDWGDVYESWGSMFED